MTSLGQSPLPLGRNWIFVTKDFFSKNMGGLSILWRNKRRGDNFSLRTVTKGGGGRKKKAPKLRDVVLLERSHQIAVKPNDFTKTT
jgi:hypothetical protein